MQSRSSSPARKLIRRVSARSGHLQFLKRLRFVLRFDPQLATHNRDRLYVGLIDLIKLIVRIDMPVLALRPGKAVERFTTE